MRVTSLMGSAPTRRWSPAALNGSRPRSRGLTAGNSAQRSKELLRWDAIEVSKRLSNPQGQEGVERPGSERRGRDRLGPPSPSHKGEGRGPGIEADEHRLVEGGRL